MKGSSSLGLTAAQVCEKEIGQVSCLFIYQLYSNKNPLSSIIFGKIVNDNGELKNFTKSGYEP